MIVRTPPRPNRWIGRLLLATALVTAANASLSQGAKTSQYYEDALVRFEKKDFAGAIVQLKNVLKVDNKNLSAQALLGKALLANGDVAAAEVAFNEALNLGVNRAEVVVGLAQALTGQAKLQEVLTGPRFAPAGLPGATKAQLLLIVASAHSDLSNPREALKAIDEARAIDTTSADTFLAEVPVRIRAQQMKEAMAAADRAIALSPNLADAHYLRGSVLHVMSQVGPAITAYDRAIALSPGHVEARLARAGLYMDRGRLDDVLQEVGELRKTSPKEPRGIYLGALAQERKGDTKAARAALADVTSLLDAIPIEFIRFRPQLLTLGGLAHFGLGNNEKAKPYLESLLRIQSDSPSIKLLGQIHLNNRNPDAAIETLDGYVKRQPRDVQAVVLLATAQLAKGRNARAVQLLQDAVKIQDSPRLRTFLGMTLVGGGKLADALAQLEAAYKKDPSQSLAGSALVDLYLRNKQPAKAIEVAEGLVKRQPKDAQMLTLLGIARMQSNDPGKARVSFEQALKLDPNFNPAKLHLARLDVAAGALEAAAQRVSGILAVDDKHIEALIEIGLIADRMKKDEEAVRYLQKAFDHSPPEGLRAGLLLVDVHLKHARVPAAAEVIKRLTEKASDNLSVVMAGANVRLAAKDLPGAQQLLTRASRLAEFDPQLQAQIAAQQLAADDAKAALYSATKALQGKPDFLQAKALTVDANIRLGDLAAAELTARDIANRYPKLALGPSLLGDVASAKGQTAAAIEAYKRAHQIEPSSASVARLFRQTERQDPAAAIQLIERWIKGHDKDVDIRRMLADAQARAGHLPAARKSYESLAALLPDDAEVLNNLANVLILAKDPEALKVAERALALKPAAPYIMGTAGWAAYQAGQIDRALQLLRDARLRDPNNPDTRFFLAATLASKGRDAEAREELTAAKKSEGRFAFAKEADALLRTLK